MTSGGLSSVARTRRSKVEKSKVAKQVNDSLLTGRPTCPHHQKVNNRRAFRRRREFTIDLCPPSIRGDKSVTRVVWRRCRRLRRKPGTVPIEETMARTTWRHQAGLSGAAEGPSLACIGLSAISCPAVAIMASKLDTKAMASTTTASPQAMETPAMTLRSSLATARKFFLRHRI